MSGLRATGGDFIVIDISDNEEAAYLMPLFNFLNSSKIKAYNREYGLRSPTYILQTSLSELESRALSTQRKLNDFVQRTLNEASHEIDARLITSLLQDIKALTFEILEFFDDIRNIVKSMSPLKSKSKMWNKFLTEIRVCRDYFANFGNKLKHESADMCFAWLCWKVSDVTYIMPSFFVTEVTPDGSVMLNENVHKNLKPIYIPATVRCALDAAIWIPRKLCEFIIREFRFDEDDADQLFSKPNETYRDLLQGCFASHIWPYFPGFAIEPPNIGITFHNYQNLDEHAIMERLPPFYEAVFFRNEPMALRGHGCRFIGDVETKSFQMAGFHFQEQMADFIDRATGEYVVSLRI